jgi:hypothetical protein
MQRFQKQKFEGSMCSIIFNLITNITTREIIYFIEINNILKWKKYLNALRNNHSILFPLFSKLCTVMWDNSFVQSVSWITINQFILALNKRTCRGMLIQYNIAYISNIAMDVSVLCSTVINWLVLATICKKRVVRYIRFYLMSQVRSCAVYTVLTGHSDHKGSHILRASLVHNLLPPTHTATLGPTAYMINVVLYDQGHSNI